MKQVPRILPLVGVAIGGVLAVNALAGARSVPDMLSGAKAFAEGLKPDQAKTGKADAAKPPAAARTGDAADAALAGAAAPPPAAARAPACAPNAAQLAKEAGLSPAELQVLQSLGERRGQLDQREADFSTQLALMAAAETKLDAKMKALNGLKADIQGLMNLADQRQAAETDRLVRVFEAMKPKDAAPRFVLLDDAVRLPIAAKMKDRSLAAIVAQMPPADAKKLTEGLARRFADAKAMAASADAKAAQAASQTPAAKPTAAAPAPAQAEAADAGDAGETAAAPKAKSARKKAPAKQARAPARKAAPGEAQAANAARSDKPAPVAAPAAAAPKGG